MGPSRPTTPGLGEDRMTPLIGTVEALVRRVEAGARLDPDFRRGRYSNLERLPMRTNQASLDGTWIHALLVKEIKEIPLHRWAHLMHATLRIGD
ncbi:uncharacterized protein N7482_005684 [Penicillium canariense]|uniref:Uncharacterized protein n=1 Tax=Penicillium canariense TaxID=189055 RepID=A0A9W9I527_9EURO|nr:uncharacterized protein N7482_005684 [Penicillium canariense]KAJ5166903.1 hypothetical protein N7482_005684 [Penicillium canariense]